MRKMNFRLPAILPVITLICFALSSCSKDKNPDQDNTPTKKELLTRKWIQVDLIASMGGANQSVFDDEIDACAQDNIFEFKADGTFVITENTVKCGVNDVVETGTWQLTENDTKIIIDPATEDPETVTIDELTATTFKGSTVDNSLGVEITLVGVFQAK